MHLPACFCRYSLLVHKMSKGMYDSRLEQLADWLRQEKDEARPLPNRSISRLAVPVWVHRSCAAVPAGPSCEILRPSVPMIR